MYQQSKLTHKNALSMDTWLDVTWKFVTSQSLRCHGIEETYVLIDNPVNRLKLEQITAWKKIFNSTEKKMHLNLVSRNSW